ncbi:MAG: isopropylmalate isomerase [Novosphingobium sp.]|nr:isopropylmalate isomerase [Novosphingobium sp.]MCP5404284.1 isopropylmalate isomerase [Novosphingobium sp.]
MADRIEHRNEQAERAHSPAAIGSAALSAAVLYAPSPDRHRDEKRKPDGPVPPDTD